MYNAIRIAFMLMFAAQLTVTLYGVLSRTARTKPHRRRSLVLGVVVLIAMTALNAFIGFALFIPLILQVTLVGAYVGAFRKVPA
jgi:hypothetical protein